MYVTFRWLVGGEVIGWHSRNLSHQPFGSNQSGIHMLVLSLQLPSSTWVGTLVPVEELRNIQLCPPLKRSQDAAFTGALLVLNWSSCFWIPSFPSLVTVWSCPLELRESLEAEAFFSANTKWGMWKGFCPWGGPHRVLLGFQNDSISHDYLNINMWGYIEIKSLVFLIVSLLENSRSSFYEDKVSIGWSLK